MIYVDTSALVKLVAPERETRALQVWMQAQVGEQFFSSQLARIELIRAVKRASPGRLDRARDVLQGLALIKMDDAIVEAAENLPPTVLRSLEAIHLATATLLGPSVRALITYDTRLADAGTQLGLNVVSPA